MACIAAWAAESAGKHRAFVQVADEATGREILVQLP